MALSTKHTIIIPVIVIVSTQSYSSSAVNALAIACFVSNANADTYLDIEQKQRYTSFVLHVPSKLFGWGPPSFI